MVKIGKQGLKTGDIIKQISISKDSSSVAVHNNSGDKLYM